MIKRERYLSKIRDFYEETSLVKILYGIRRSGKSTILTQIIDELYQLGVKENQVIFINFESLEYYDLRNSIELYKHIRSIIDEKSKYYIFLDEVQKVSNFEECINSLRITGRLSIFVTGSNSKMSFNELSTDLSGRYVSFRVHPLSFSEVVELTKTKKEDYGNLLTNIFEWGTLPQRFTLPSDLAILNYITDVYNSIVLKDVVERIGVKDVTSFEKILQYVIETEGREFSTKNILNYLKTDHKSMSTQTIYSYLDALCSTFIVNKVYRYDVEGKSVLKTLNKYYVSDLGITKIKFNKKEINYSRALENMVFNELLTRGYEIHIGKTKKGEIDFIASKNKNYRYVQVTYLLESEKTITREFGAYSVIKDNYKKYVISLDKENLSRDGIIHLNAIDFFMGDEF